MRSINVRRKKRCVSVRGISPALAGFAAAAMSTALLCGVFSLVFFLLNRIVYSAVLPLALLSAAAGAFLGGLVCARMTGSRGLIYGAAVGLLLFALLTVIGLLCDGDPFGKYAAVKLLLLVGSGAVGGYLGGKRR